MHMLAENQASWHWRTSLLRAVKDQRHPPASYRFAGSFRKAGKAIQKLPKSKQSSGPQGIVLANYAAALGCGFASGGNEGILI